jgi:DNA-directed RNA polymerase subunit RPC12/RpoP
MSKNIYYYLISQLKTMITKSYFCFECGAILTTKEDKKQHDEWELHKKTTEPKDQP